MHGKHIVITVAASGATSIDLHGFHGEGCQAVVDSFGQGDTCTELTTKNEFYEAETESEKAVL